MYILVSESFESLGSEKGHYTENDTVSEQLLTSLQCSVFDNGP
jgi:hypothetical protein